MGLDLTKLLDGSAPPQDIQSRVTGERERSKFAPNVAGVFHVRSPELPQFQFEYHPQSRAAYVVFLQAQPRMAMKLADIGSAEELLLVANAWIAGYRFGSNPPLNPTAKD
jgi:hypothetical protein